MNQFQNTHRVRTALPSQLTKLRTKEVIVNPEWAVGGTAQSFWRWCVAQTLTPVPCFQTKIYISIPYLKTVRKNYQLISQFRPQK